MSDETASPAQFKVSWIIGILAAFAIFALIAGYSSRMTNTYTDYDQERVAVRLDNLAKVQKAENELLNPVDAQGKPSAVWADQAKGTIRIPIEEAMAQEVDVLKAKAPVVGADLNPPAPPPPAAAASAAKPGAAPAAAPAAPAKPGAAPSTAEDKPKTPSPTPSANTGSPSTPTPGAPNH